MDGGGFCILLRPKSCFLVKGLPVVFVLSALYDQSGNMLGKVATMNNTPLMFEVEGLTASCTSPSSGLGSLSNKPMLNKTVEILRDGCHAPYQKKWWRTMKKVLTKQRHTVILISRWLQIASMGTTEKNIVSNKLRKVEKKSKLAQFS